MNIQEYISSGVLEQYVAGLLSDKEMREVETMAVRFPEVKNELNEIENALEKYAFAQAQSPKNDLKEKILTQITNEEKIEKQPHEAKIISLNRNLRLMQYGMAAAMIGFIIAAWSNFLLTERLIDAKKTIAELRSEKSRVVQDYDVLRANYETVVDENTKKFTLTGTPKHEDSKLTVYWQPSSKIVLANISQLPPAPAGKQYQLWAIGSAGPVDAGVLTDSIDSLQQMKNITEAATFAITLEKTGGSPTPTLEEMYAIAK